MAQIILVHCSFEAEGNTNAPCRPITSGRLPDLIEDPGRDFSLVLVQEPPIVLRDHFGGVLDRIAGLFVGPGLLQDMRCQNVPDVVGTVGQQTLDGSALCPGVVDTIALDGSAPGLLEGVLAIGRIGAGHLRRLYEQCIRIGGRTDQPAAVPVDPDFKQFIEAVKVRQDQAERP